VRFVQGETMDTQRERLMSETKGFLRVWGGVVMMVALLFVVAVALTGCAQPAPIAAVEPTATAYGPPPTDIPVLAPGPTPAALDFPLPPPTQVESESIDDETCVSCHTDEETLKALAEEKEVEEELSEGEG
jgi:hypothetical protein